jgi:hypothetical protein
MNTLKKHNFQDAFKKKCQKRWEWCICMEENYFEGDVGQYAQSWFLTR